MRDLPSDHISNLVDAKQLVDMRHIYCLYILLKVHCML